MPLKDRASLKGYFAQNAVPTAENFADLVDSMLSLGDDGLQKTAGQALRLQVGTDSKALGFYRDAKPEARPVWTIGLNPGWNVSDAAGNARLSIDEATGKLTVQGEALVNGAATFKDNAAFNGKIGVGITPQATLDVKGIVAISNGDREAIAGRLQPGALSIGSTSASYGGGKGADNKNMAALVLETNATTEIAVNEAGKRQASLLYYEGKDAARITIGRDMGVGSRVSRVSVACDADVNGNLWVSGAVHAAYSNPLRHRMYPDDPTVHQDIFDAKKVGVIQRVGNGGYDETSYAAPGAWQKRRIIMFGNDNEADGNGAQIAVPDKCETVWVRVLGDRWAYFKAFFGQQDLGFWCGGYRASNAYCPDGSLTEGFSGVLWTVATKSGERADDHQWVPIPVPGAGMLRLVPKTNNQGGFFLSGVAFSRNPWKHAAHPAAIYLWKSNGGSAATWETHNSAGDLSAYFPVGASHDLMVPVVPSRRDKLLYLIQHNGDANGCGHTAITVNGKPVERFLATWDNPFARHWNSRYRQRYIAARVPASLVPETERFLKVNIDLTKQNEPLYFREIGTHDLEVPLPA